MGELEQQGAQDSRDGHPVTRDREERFRRADGADGGAGGGACVATRQAGQHQRQLGQDRRVDHRRSPTDGEMRGLIGDAEPQQDRRGGRPHPCLRPTGCPVAGAQGVECRLAGVGHRTGPAEPVPAGRLPDGVREDARLPPVTDQGDESGHRREAAEGEEEPQAGRQGQDDAEDQRQDRREAQEAGRSPRGFRTDRDGLEDLRGGDVVPAVVVDQRDPAPARAEPENRRHREIRGADASPVEERPVHRVQVLQEDRLHGHGQECVPPGESRVGDHDVAARAADRIAAAREWNHLAGVGARLDDEDERWQPGRDGLGRDPAADDDRPVREVADERRQPGQGRTVDRERCLVACRCKPAGERCARRQYLGIDDDLPGGEGARGSARERDVQIHRGLLGSDLPPRLGRDRPRAPGAWRGVDKRPAGTDAGGCRPGRAGSAQEPPLHLIIVSTPEAHHVRR
ncbi:hypothetical protein QFZ50_001986 [Arthrobacter agilis]|nr:hypothetical protein [Arthrobacter agilis]